VIVTTIRSWFSFAPNVDTMSEDGAKDAAVGHHL
jgi:hypothetical protein